MSFTRPIPALVLLLGLTACPGADKSGGADTADTAGESVDTAPAPDIEIEGSGWCDCYDELVWWRTFDEDPVSPEPELGGFEIVEAGGSTTASVEYSTDDPSYNGTRYLKISDLGDEGYACTDISGVLDPAKEYLIQVQFRFGDGSEEFIFGTDQDGTTMVSTPIDWLDTPSGTWTWGQRIQVPGNITRVCFGAGMELVIDNVALFKHIPDTDALAAPTDGPAIVTTAGLFYAE